MSRWKGRPRYIGMQKRMRALYRIATCEDLGLDYRYEAARNMVRLREEYKASKPLPPDVLRILYRVNVRRWWKKNGKESGDGRKEPNGAIKGAGKRGRSVADIPDHVCDQANRRLASEGKA